MNKIIAVLAFTMFVGFSLAEAGGKPGGGWSVTEVTGTAKTIFEGRGYLKAITVSEGSLNDYVVALTTVPSRSTGGGVTLIPSDVTLTTTSITTLVYTSTGTNSFNAGGGCDTCYVEVPGTGGLHIRQTSEGSGQNNKVTVLWSK